MEYELGVVAAAAAEAEKQKDCECAAKVRSAARAQSIGRREEVCAPQLAAEQVRRKQQQKS